MSNQRNLPLVESNQVSKSSDQWNQDTPEQYLRMCDLLRFLFLFLINLQTSEKTFHIFIMGVVCRIFKEKWILNHFGIRLQHKKMWKQWSTVNTFQTHRSPDPPPLRVRNKVRHKTHHPAVLLYSIFQKRKTRFNNLNNMLKSSPLPVALVLIQYTLYNRLIVWEPLLLQFHSEKIPDTSWLQVRKEESKKWNWNTFTQFVKQYLKTKERERTLSSITLSSALWNGVGGGGGGGRGAVSEDQLTEPIPLSIMWMRCHAPNSKPWNSKATISQIQLLLFFNSFHISYFFSRFLCLLFWRETFRHKDLFF